MATFVIFADAPHKMRSDGRNTIVASGVDGAAARANAETLLNQPGALASFAAVEFDDVTPAFAVEGFRPVGSRDQSVWPTMTRGGATLPGV